MDIFRLTRLPREFAHTQTGTHARVSRGTTRAAAAAALDPARVRRGSLSRGGACRDKLSTFRCFDFNATKKKSETTTWN